MAAANTYGSMAETNTYGSMAAANPIPIPQSAEDITPSWVQQVLQRDVPGVIITDVDVKGSVSKGEGYLGDVIAFDTVGTRKGTGQRYSLVAKLTNFALWLGSVQDYPMDLQRKAKQVLIKAEATEVKFYYSIVPDLLCVQVHSTEANVKSNGEDGEECSPADSFLPKCYFTATDPTTVVSVRVMENLKSQGFSIKAGDQCLSCEEMMLTVGALAQLHGLSRRLERLAGTSLSEKYGMALDEPLVDLEDSTTAYQIGVKTFAAVFPDQADLVARLEKVDVQTVMCDAMEKSRGLKVLNHGDCWINNIMIKYEEEVPVQVKLVDWQMVQYLPLTCDLACLFVTSASWDAFHNHRGAILAHYHQELMKTLGSGESLGLHNYTLEQLVGDFKADCLYGLVQYLQRLPVEERPSPEPLQNVREIGNWGLI